MLLGSYLACLGMPFSSARGPAIPSLGNPAHVRNRRPTCETAGSHAGHVGTQVTVAHSQSMTDHGAATHRPAMQHSQERGKHDHLQQRLSHATKPKSHPASNTIYLSSKLTPTTYNTDFFAPTSRKVTLSATRSVLSPKLSPIPDKRCNSNALMSQLDKSHRGITCDIVGEPRQRSTKDRVEDGSPQERTQYGLTRHPRG